MNHKNTPSSPTRDGQSSPAKNGQRLAKPKAAKKTVFEVAKIDKTSYLLCGSKTAIKKWHRKQAQKRVLILAKGQGVEASSTRYFNVPEEFSVKSTAYFVTACCDNTSSSSITNNRKQALEKGLATIQRLLKENSFGEPRKHLPSMFNLSFFVEPLRVVDLRRRASA